MMKIKVAIIALFCIFLNKISAQDLTYTFRINTLTSLDKLFPFQVDDLDYNKKNISIGGLIRGRAFKLNGMRLGFDYGRYNYNLADQLLEYKLETYRLLPGKDFIVYDSKFRVLVGFEFIFGIKSSLNYEIRDIALSNNVDNSTEPVDNFIDKGYVINEFMIGMGLIAEIEKKIFSDVFLGFGLSLSATSNDKSFLTKGDYSYSFGGSEQSEAYFFGYSGKRKYFFDPIARLYLRF